MREKSLMMLMAALMLCGCTATGSQTDQRTGKPFPESPTSPRELALKYYVLDLFDQYRVSHAYLDGINIQECYAGAERDDVRFVMVQFSSGPPEPGYLMNRADVVARRGHPVEMTAKHQMIGVKKKNARDGTEWVQFDKFCGDWTAGGAVTLGIRDKRSWTIQQYVDDQEDWSRRYNAEKIARGEAFRSVRFPTETLVRGGNQWTHLHEKSPTAPGMDEGEVWMMPVGDSNYYFYLSFGYVSGARAASGAEYMRTRALVEQIIDSFKIEKL